MPRKHRNSTVSMPIASTPALTQSCFTGPRFLLEHKFPVRELHMLISGTAPRGEISTFVLGDFIRPWQQGLPVMGYKSYPTPFCYVDCCYSIFRLALLLNHVNYPFLTSFPGLSLVDNPPPSPDANLFDHALHIARQRVPNLKVLFLDGITHIYQGSDVARFEARIRKIAQRENITVMGIDEYDNIDEILADLQAKELKGNIQ